MTFLTIAKTSPSIGYNNPGNVHFPIISSTNRYAFAYDGVSKYITGGVGGQIYYSTDGNSWIGSRLYPTTGNEVRCIIWDGSKFVAAAGGIWTSTDGIDWFRTNTTAFYSVAYNSGIYVAYAGTTIQSSTDCITWTTRYTSPRGSNNAVVTWVGDCFIVGDGTSGLIFKSTNGINWTVSNEGLDKYLIAPSNGTSYKIYGAATIGRNSTDGLNWNAVNNYTAAGADEVLWDSTNSRYVMVGGGHAMTSTDGYTYTNRSPVITHQAANPLFFGIAKNPTGNFVAVGSLDTKLYSTDAITWSANNTTRLYPSNSSTNTTSLTAGNGAYVMGRNAATLLRSTDGIAWTEISTPLGATAYNWRCRYGNKFVAVSYGNNKVMNSTDGITWASPSTMPSSANWIIPTWNGSVYTTVSFGATAAAYSTDGVTWTARTLPTNANWIDSASLGSTMLFIANNSISTVRSTDGITWTQGAMPLSRAWQGLASNGTHFVAVAFGTNICARSTDGVTWTEYTMASTNNWQYIVWDGNRFYVPSSTGNLLSSSTDGITWVNQRLTSTGATHVATLNGDVVMSSTSTNDCFVSKAGTQAFVSTGAPPVNYTVQYNTNINKFLCYGTSRLVQESTDGVTWTYNRLSFLPQLRYSGIAYGNNTLVTISGMAHGQSLGSTNICAFSKNEGLDWGQSYFFSNSIRQGIAFGAGRFVAVSVAAGSSPGAANFIEHSTDGVRWQTATMPLSLVWTDVTWTGSEFFAVASGGGRGGSPSAARSTDGLTWTSATMPISLSWQSITYGNGAYVANWIQTGTGTYNSRNTVYRSTDGIAWTTITLTKSAWWGKVRYVGNYFVSFSNGLSPPGTEYGQEGSGFYMYSTDGVTWTQSEMPTPGYYGEIAYNGSVYCVVKGSHHDVEIKKLAYISTDLVTWTAVNMPIQARWYAITNIGTKFVAIADNDHVCATSTDGTNWTLTTTPVQQVIWRSCADNATTWCGGSLGTMLSTTDNQNYNRYVYDYTTDIRTLFKTNSGLMFGGGGGLLGKIDEEKIWTTYPNRASTTALMYIGSGNGLAFYNTFNGGYPTEYLYIRKNKWWTLIHKPFSAESMSIGVKRDRIAYDGVKYYSKTQNGGAAVHARIISSTDGYTWRTEKDAIGLPYHDGLTYFKNRFIAYNLGTGGSYPLYTSTDGVTWGTGVGNTWTWRKASNNSVLIIPEMRFFTSVYVTTDAITWSSPAVTNIGQTDIYWHSPTSKFLLFGTTGALSSTDGTTWTSNTGLYPSKQSDVMMLADNTFVVFATVSGTLNKYTSTNGLAWSAATPCNLNLASYIFYDEQSFVTFTSSGLTTMYTSDDGINWYQSRILTNVIRDVKQTGSYIAAVDSSLSISPGNAMTSTDGINWSSSHIASDSYHGIASNGTGEVIAVGNTFIAKSSNSGTSWSQFAVPVTPTVPSYSNLSINYVDSNYTICHAGTNSPNIIFRSTDLLNWSVISYNRMYNNANTSYIPSIYDSTTLNGKTVIVASTVFYTLYSNVFTSTDGTTWYSPPLTSPMMGGGAPVCCTNDGTKFLVVNQNKYAYTSTDGYNWTESSILPVTTTGGNTQFANTWPLVSATWTGTYFVVVRGRGQCTQTESIYYNISTDGITWTERSNLQNLQWREVYMFKGSVVALAYGNSTYMTSTDALTWTTRNFPRAVFPTSAHNDNILVVFDYNAGTKSSILTSTDGISWTQISVPQYDFNNYGSVIWNGSEFLAKGARKANGYVDVLKSTDGITWTYNEVYFANSPFATVWVNNEYVTQNGFELAQSTDGISWVSDPGKTSFFYTKTGSDYYRGASLGAVYKNGSLTTPNLNVTLNSITYG